jgi:hypothetical protein
MNKSTNTMNKMELAIDTGSMLINTPMMLLHTSLQLSNLGARALNGVASSIVPVTVSTGLFIKEAGYGFVNNDLTIEEIKALSDSSSMADAMANAMKQGGALGKSLGTAVKGSKEDNAA